VATGTVKWFNNAKGYGFILPDTGGEDLFAHYSAIQMDGYKTLKAGQAVEFDRVEGDKGYHALNIRSVENVGDAAAGPVAGGTSEDGEATSNPHHTDTEDSPDPSKAYSDAD
jgi:CspA family cold shock protein